ncbi:MAG: Gfo/Idh/MocA family oxidoreductase [Alphaproteobacteria bacterium]|nr:Gfo/Idh/MocA family oxidoreductase [Alphaproteobacteria bacterium]
MGRASCTLRWTPEDRGDLSRCPSGHRGPAAGSSAHLDSPGAAPGWWCATPGVRIVSSRPGQGARARRFALIGAAGYIAPRHLAAIHRLGDELVAATDTSDSVGVLDRYFPEADFFVQPERFWAHLRRLRGEGRGVDFVSICSPNHVHTRHALQALERGAHAICEKPLALHPSDVDRLIAAQRQANSRVYPVLQLRLHPVLGRIRDIVESAPAGHRFDVALTYITRRGPWYLASWKGDELRSGGLVFNIGIHFFDLLLQVFGAPQSSVVHARTPRQVAGSLTFERARVRWFLSIDGRDLARASAPEGAHACRSLTIDGQQVDFTNGFTELHTACYREILLGRGLDPAGVLPVIRLASALREAPLEPHGDDPHPLYTGSEPR